MPYGTLETLTSKHITEISRAFIGYAKRFIKLGREVGFNGSVDIVELFWDKDIACLCQGVAQAGENAYQLPIYLTGF